MRFKLPKIYPITDARISGISIPEQVRRLVAGGSTFIQLRDKHSSSQAFFESAAEAISIARPHGVRIIINDRVDIALALKADGVHLGQDDLPCTHARRILGDEAIIGLSTHSPEQAIAALSLPINYIAIGPIFSTTTKDDPDAPVGLEGLTRTRSLIADFPLVAIGGIMCANMQEVFEAGADSVAVISDLVSDADQITLKLRSMLEKWSDTMPNNIKHS